MTLSLYLLLPVLLVKLRYLEAIRHGSASIGLNGISISEYVINSTKQQIRCDDYCEC